MYRFTLTGDGGALIDSADSLSMGIIGHSAVRQAEIVKSYANVAVAQADRDGWARPYRVRIVNAYGTVIEDREVS